MQPRMAAIHYIANRPSIDVFVEWIPFAMMRRAADFVHRPKTIRCGRCSQSWQRVCRSFHTFEHTVLMYIYLTANQMVRGFARYSQASSFHLKTFQYNEVCKYQLLIYKKCTTIHTTYFDTGEDGSHLPHSKTGINRCFKTTIMPGAMLRRAARCWALLTDENFERVLTKNNHW